VPLLFSAFSSFRMPSSHTFLLKSDGLVIALYRDCLMNQTSSGVKHE